MLRRCEAFTRFLDDGRVCMMAADTLADAGFSVIEAGVAMEAKATLAREPGIAVLFTDVNMPGHMDGVALAHHAADQHPAVGLIVTSGACRIEGGELTAGQPFSRQALLRARSRQPRPPTDSVSLIANRHFVPKRHVGADTVFQAQLS